jgi:hypothetical protein
MRLGTAFLTFLLLATTAALAGNTTDVTEVGKDSFEADFPSGGHLHLHIRSGDISVRGSDQNKIRVRYDGKNSDQLKDVKISLKSSGDSGDLHISGGPRNDFRIIIEVPKNSDLWMRVAAGDVEVADVVGSKDVELYAGDLTLQVGSPSDYGHMDASVRAGDLDTGPFGVSKDGLFRSYETQGGGKYRLHAHVTAGDLTLKE